jgi:hypothetical protein
MATLGDTFRVYIKPSLDGQLVIRKKTTNQTSAAVKARQAKLASLPKSELPSVACHNELVAAGKCPTKRVYSQELGRMAERAVCPIKLMKVCMRKRMKRL